MKRPWLLTLPLLLALSACGSPDPGAKDDATSGEGVTHSSPEPDVPAVAGLAPGEIPAIPLVVLPDLSMVDQTIAGASIELRDEIGAAPGLTVKPAVCDAAGDVETGPGEAMDLYGDKSTEYTGPDGTMYNSGDGTGNFVLNGIEVSVFGDGSGSYEDPATGTSFLTAGDGSGTYVVGDVAISISSDGSGNEYGPGYSIIVGNDGSGEYTADENGVVIQNRGDGSAHYEDDKVTIVNDGDGTATVNGVEVPADPIPPVPPIGAFPPVAALAPVPTCGTTISLDSGILFDFGSDRLHPETGPLLDSLAKVLSDAESSELEVSGHTDSIGDEASNLTLSKERADAVADALRSRGVTATIETVGYGAARPVAANELNSQDNPAGRQLNRRVEVFVPAG